MINKQRHKKMVLRNRFFIFFFLLAINTFLSKRIAFSNEKNFYKIISDTQSQNMNGEFEAFGNVIINDQNNFNARSDRMIFEKEKSKLKLFGDVKIYGYQHENIFIEELQGDEFILFTDKGQFQINSKTDKRVRTKFKF